MRLLAQHLVSGLAVGCLYAFMAVGIVLIFRSTRTLNFSHGMMATAGAFAYAILVDDHGWNAGLAFVAIIFLGVLVGLGTYGVIGRPLVRATPLARTIATILWMLVTQGVMLLIISKPQRSIPALFSQEPVVVGGVALSRQAIGVVVFTAVGVGALYAFFRRSKYGLAVRAVAEARRSASIVGIPLLRVDAVAWILGGVTAVCGGALVAPFSIGDFQQLNLLLVRVLAAALVGGFVSVPGALLGGLTLGIGEELLGGYVPQFPQLRELLPFLVVMAVVIAQSFGWLKKHAEGAGDDDLRISTTVRRTVGTGSPNGRRVFGMAALAAVVIAPQMIGTTWSFVLGRGFIYGLVALSLVVVTGFSGQISLAQASFMAIGAYFGHFLIVRTDVFGFWTVLPLLALLGAVVAAGLSVAALRVRGLYLAIVTWTFGLVVDRMVLRWNWLVNAGHGGLHGAGGGVEANLTRPDLFGINLFDDTRFVYVLAGLAILAGLVVRNYSNSRTGLAVRAQRDEEPAALTSGLAVWRLRMGAFMLSGALATVAGFLVLAHQGTVIPLEFNQFFSLNFMLILVLGGTESWVGAIAAGIFYAFGPDLFQRLPLVSGDWQFVVLGTAGIILIALTEGGLGASLRQKLRGRFTPGPATSSGLVAARTTSGNRTGRRGWEQGEFGRPRGARNGAAATVPLRRRRHYTTTELGQGGTR
jgi:branched-chain amino acid transport system permease protein